MKTRLWTGFLLRILLPILAVGSELRGADLPPGANAAVEATAGAATQGLYFARKQYQPQPLPRYESTRDKLPAPVHDENPDWVRMYWKAWELAFRNFHEPAPGSGLVSQFIDAAFNDNIFLWDTAFMTMFCNYGHGLVPGIGSLDNFYARQHNMRTGRFAARSTGSPGRTTRIGATPIADRCSVVRAGMLPSPVCQATAIRPSSIGDAPRRNRRRC